MNDLDNHVTPCNEALNNDWECWRNTSSPKSRKKRILSTDSSDGQNCSSRYSVRDYHHYRQCPIDGCMSAVKCTPPHLRKHHKITSTSEINIYWVWSDPMTIRSWFTNKKFHQIDIGGLVDTFNDTRTLKHVADKVLKKLVNKESFSVRKMPTCDWRRWWNYF